MPNALSTILPLGSQLTLFSSNVGPLQVSAEPSAAAGVTSFNGRTGAVVGQNGDYSSSQITNASAVPGTNVTDALNNLRTDDATLAAAIAALQVFTIVDVPGATYDLSVDDLGKYLRFTNAAGCVVTVPGDTFLAGQWVLMRQAAAGAVSFSNLPGEVVLTPPVTNNPVSGQQGATFSIIFRDDATADLSGDLQDI
jgi:hypothetical protein